MKSKHVVYNSSSSSSNNSSIRILCKSYRFLFSFQLSRHDRGASIFLRAISPKKIDRAYFRCKYCIKTYTSLSALNKHLKSHQSRMNNPPNGNGSQSLMICNKCINKKFITKKALQLHQIRTHNNNSSTTINNRYLRQIAYAWIDPRK